MSTNKKASILMSSAVAVLSLVVMVILSKLLPQAQEANRLFIIVSNWLFMTIIVVMVVNIEHEVRSKL